MTNKWIKTSVSSSHRNSKVELLENLKPRKSFFIPCEISELKLRLTAKTQQNNVH